MAANWKQAAIQQAGIQMSKKYPSLSESFSACSRESGKVNFDNLTQFFTQHNLLHGFSMTPQLLQELFGELDPHKKGYLSYNDWKNAFGAYNFQDQQLLELKTLVSASFTNYDSAFKFLLSFSNGTALNESSFEQAVVQLSNERFGPEHAAKLWTSVSENGRIDKFTFRKHFG